MPHDKIKTGGGGRCLDDLIPPGVEIVDRDDLDFLLMKCLAKRTTECETLNHTKDQSTVYTQVLEERMTEILTPALHREIKIVTNMDAIRVVPKRAEDLA